MKSKVKYRPQGETLCRFGLSRKDVQIMRGPLGSGKTKAFVFKIIKLISEQRADKNRIRKSRICAVRNTYPDLQTTTIREFRECVSPAMGTFRNGHPPTFEFYFELADGTTVEATVDFLALDRPDDVRKLRGTQYTFAWMNEVKEMPKAILSMLLARIDRFPTPGFSSWVGILGDSNAWDEEHWLAVLEEEWVQGKLVNYEFFSQPGAVIECSPDDPGATESLNGTFWKVNDAAENLIVLRRGYYQRQIAGKKDDWIKVELGNHLGLSFDGKAVQPDYMESVHRAQQNLRPVPGVTIRVGVDFGLTPAAAFMQQIPSGRWHALDEILFEDGDAELLARAIKIKVVEMQDELGPGSEPLKFVFRGDPSGDTGVQTNSDTPFKIMRLNGVPCFPASTNEPSIRRSALRRPLTRMVTGGPGILFSPKCKYLRKGLAGAFTYKRILVAGADRFQDKPDKNFWSHICEAAEYAVMDGGEHAIIDSTAFGATKMPDVPVHPHSRAQPPRAGSTWSVFDV